MPQNGKNNRCLFAHEVKAINNEVNLPIVRIKLTLCHLRHNTSGEMLTGHRHRDHGNHKIGTYVITGCQDLNKRELPQNGLVVMTCWQRENRRRLRSSDFVAHEC